MQYANRVNLIVCQKSKISDWINHFKEHYTRNCVFDLTNKKDLEFFIEQVKCEVPTLMVGVINYDLLYNAL